MDFASVIQRLRLYPLCHSPHNSSNMSARSRTQYPFRTKKGEGRRSSLKAEGGWGEPPAFDFHLLGQMKTKGSEPIAKYLLLCVSLASNLNSQGMGG